MIKYYITQASVTYSNTYPPFVVYLDHVHPDGKSYHTVVSVTIVTILGSLVSDQVGIE